MTLVNKQRVEGGGHVDGGGVLLRSAGISGFPNKLFSTVLTNTHPVLLSRANTTRDSFDQE